MNIETNIKPEVKSRERLKNASEAAKPLRELGEILAPEGTKYIGSFASHFYKNEMSEEVFFISQSTAIHSVPESIVTTAMQELGRKLMQDYGHKVPAKRFDVKEVDV